MASKLHIGFLLLPILFIIGGCNKSDSQSTPVQLTVNPPTPDLEPTKTELDSLSGQHQTGELFIRYKGASSELKKWTIQSPFEIIVSKEYIEVHFSGSYYIDNEKTPPGKKRLFIKKQDINMIFLSE
ncbi:MAG: hypothetical protein ACSHX6_10790 [Akkermansiaceae bacterium]